MTPKERLQAILRGQGAHRAACICPGGMMNMVTEGVMEVADTWLPAAHTDSAQMARLARAVYDAGCFENVGVPFCMTVEAQAMGAPVELGTSAVEPHVTRQPLQSCEQLAQLRPMNLKAGRPAVVLQAISLLRQQLPEVPVVGNLTGPVSVAASLVEPTVFYKELRKKPTAAHACMAFITEQLMAFGLAMLEAGADVIAISDPSGTGEILGPRYFETFTAAYLNRLIAPLKAAGAQVIVHICGQMQGVYPQLDTVRGDALSFDSAVPMAQARQALPGRVLMGNVSTYALEFGTPEKVAQLTRGCISDGADIVSPACGLGMRSPLDNVCAMLAAVREDG